MKKIVIVVVAVAFMLAYVWMRSLNNRLAENVADLERGADILEAKLEREQIELSKRLVVTVLEPRARDMGLYYPWEVEVSEEDEEGEEGFVADFVTGSVTGEEGYGTN